MRRNSLLNDVIKEEQSVEFSQDLNFEFRDSDDDESISLSLGDAVMVRDEELRLSGRPASETASVEEPTGHEEEEEISPQSKDKSITETIQKRTRRVCRVTWYLLGGLGIAAILGSYFITRKQNCKDKRDKVRKSKFLVFVEGEALF